MNNKQLVAKMILFDGFHRYRAEALSSVSAVQRLAHAMAADLSVDDASSVILSCAAYIALLRAGHQPSPDDYRAIVTDMLQ